MQNTFSEHIFNPETEEDRKVVVEGMERGGRQGERNLRLSMRVMQTDQL